MTFSSVRLADARLVEQLPGELLRGEAVDMDALVNAAKRAASEVDDAITRAGKIVEGNALTRMWNSADFQSSVVRAIGGLGTVAKVNLVLSAICNDLAATNLRQSKRLDQYHEQIAAQLTGIEALLVDERLPGDSRQHAARVERLSELAGRLDELGQSLDTVRVAMAEADRRLRAVEDRVASAETGLGLAQSEMHRLQLALNERVRSLKDELSHRDQALVTQLKAVRADWARLHDEALERIRQGYTRATAYSDERNRHMMRRLVWVAGALLVVQAGGWLALAIKTGVL